MSKCECKECLHYDVCREWNAKFIEHRMKMGEGCVCKNFKSKSLFVELPCAVGTPVYVIEFCHCYNSYEEQCLRRRTKASKWLSVTKRPSSHRTECVKLFERPFKIEYLIRIGKTVFLDRAEAEKKLKEG